MQYVTVVNRTSKNLYGTWDGRQYTIAPGKNSFPIIQAQKFRDQNPIMGSMDPMSGQMDYKIGIEEDNDPCTPLEGVVEGVEKWDRSKLAGARPSEVVAGDNGLYQLGRSAGSTPLPVDAGFVNPSN